MTRHRKLTTEDRILWGKVARSTRAFAGKLDDLADLEELLTPPEAPPPPPPAGLKPDLRGLEIGKQAPVKSEKIHHPLEKPVKRKLSRGHLTLEARIDLHGLMQADAHILLLDFISRAHMRGLRHVLVITGKGSSMGSEGVLKRAVPMWFSKPEFRHLISSYEPAAQNHGGEGALYVRLSRVRPED